MHRVLISEKICDEAISYLTQKGIEVKIGSGIDEASIIDDIQDCDSVIVRLVNISKKVIDSARSLKLIAKHGVGCDSIDVEYAKQKGIAVINTPGANSQSVAEHTVGLILSCAHQIVNGNDLYKKGRFYDNKSLKITELNGKTVGLIGCGTIGKKVADILCCGFNMRVFGFDPFISEDSKQENIIYLDSIDKLLADSDFVSLHLPLLESTRKIVDRSFLKKMKKDAYLINTARGELVDNDALLEFVSSDLIAGAGLDVTYPEPLDNEELINNPKVIITPHCGASSKEALYRMGMETAYNIISFYKKCIIK